MKKSTYKSLLLLILSVILYIPALSQQPAYKEGELLVKFAPNQTARSVLSENRFSEMNVKIKEHYPNLEVWLLSYEDPSRTNRELLERVKEDFRIKSVQFNHQVTLRTTIPNDQYFGNQWSLRNTGQTGGTTGADISATDAWNITTGVSGNTSLGDEIITAVVDDGFDLDHEDLGFTNLVYNVSIDSENPADMPVGDHGTAIAGIIGAQGDNTDGITGIGWNTTVLPIGDVYDSDTLIFEDNVIASYEYILDLRKQYNQTNGQEGLYIVATNSSFGLGAYGANPTYHQVWCDSYDSLGVHGILNIAATANYNVDIDQVSDVPTACESDYFISVTNTDDNDNKYNGPSGGAGWGATTIDLGAPGELIFSTVPDDNYGDYNVFGPISGTSYATPHVTGTIPLIYSILPQDLLTYYKTNPAQAPLDIKTTILNSVDPNTSLQAYPTVTEGRLNVFNALKNSIENYGADLGLGMNQVTLTDEITIQNPNTKFTLHSDLLLHDDISFASGSNLTIESESGTVNIAAASGTITIGGPGGAFKIAGGNNSGEEDSDDEGSGDTENPQTVPQQFMLSNNYPNPFNPTTVISYQLPVTSQVTLRVFDMLGREVATLVNDVVPAGQHEVHFDASNLSSGLYIYHLQAGEFLQTKKMMLIK